MKSYDHGGDIYSFFQKYGEYPIDFSSSVNPFGIPEGVKRVYWEEAESCGIYPDYACRELTEALAVFEKIPADYFYCGAGAADIIFRIAFGLKPRRALLTAPAFSEYEKALLQSGASVDFHFLREEEGFALTERILENIPGKDVLFLCNPDNPTGNLINSELFQRILEKCRGEGCVLVLDECFGTLAEGFVSAVAYLEAYKNLIILKAFTKTYAIAGLRLGYCITSDKETLEKIQNAGQSWSVSGPAQKCGVAALKETEYLKNSVKFIEREKEYLIKCLTRSGAKVYGSKANYIFFRFPHDDVQEKMAKRGFLIRSFKGQRGLDGFFYRIAVRRAWENSAFINALSGEYRG